MVFNWNDENEAICDASNGNILMSRHCAKCWAALHYGVWI
jgi:hypothetical protein